MKYKLSLIVSQPKISPGLNGFSAQTFKEDLIIIVLKLFYKIKTEGTLLNSFTVQHIPITAWMAMNQKLDSPEKDLA